MKTVLKSIYSFEELSEAAKERARQWWRDCENEDFDTEYLYEDAARMGALLGIEIDKRPIKLMGGGTRYDPAIYWSLYNQGSGACFEGRYRYAKGAAKAIEKETGGTEHALVDIAKRLAAVQRRNFYRLEAIIKHTGSYTHEFSMEIDVFDRDDNNRSATPDGEIRDCMRAFAKWIYGQIQAEYEYRMSDENVDDCITANEYEFDENGTIAR